MTLKGRFRLQFSLKASLLVLTSACVIVGNLADRMHRQRNAVDTVLRAGCNVTYDYNPDTKPIEDAVRVTRSTQRPFWFDLLHSPTHIIVNLGGNCAQALAQLKDLPTVCDIDIFAAVKDHDLAALKGWHGPRYLGVWDVTDTELAHIPALDGLRVLCLSDTEITDSSIPALTRLKTLRHLSIFGTQLTERGLIALRAAIPSCNVAW